MRIIKDSPNALKAIAGEIVNIESSELRFIDGAIIANPTKGYPRVISGNVRNDIRATCGYIVVPSDVLRGRFIRELAQLVETLSLGTKVVAHTIKSGRVTNVKVETCQANTHTGDGKPGANTKRLFRIWESTGNAYDHLPGTARFNWVVVSALDFNLKIVPGEINDAISRHVCSIFYDRDDLCTLDHNEVTMEFGEHLMRTYTDIADQNIIWDQRADVALFNIGKSPLRPSFLIEIPRHKLFAATMADIQLEAGVDDLLRCRRCSCEIWGEFYAMDGKLDDPNCAHSVPYCAICGHSGASSDYMRVLRIMSPVTRDQVLAKVPDQLRDIINEAAKGVDMRGDITTIGDKYVSMSRKSFLFSRHVEYAGRKLIGL